MKAYLVLVWAKSEMLYSLSGILGSSQQQGVASCRSSQCKLIQSQNFSTSSQNPGTCSSSESERGHTKLGNCEKTVVICNRADNNNGLVVRLLGSVRHDSRQRYRRPVDARHKEATKDNFVERRISAA
jgi:hypothetical protein